MEEVGQKECKVPSDATRIFLSYARQQEVLAEAVYLRLIGEGYVVFWDKDKDSLPPGQAFDNRISLEIQLADIMVFLVSKASISNGSYALTELEIARESRPNPSGYFLPVLVEPLQVQELPEFFKSVTVLRPKGNVVAETLFSVQQLLADRRGVRTISQKLALIDQMHEDARLLKDDLRIAKIDADWKHEKSKYYIEINGRKTSYVISKEWAIAPVVGGLVMSLFGLVNFTMKNPEFFGVMPTISPICVGLVAGIAVWIQAGAYESKRAAYLKRRKRTRRRLEPPARGLL